MTSPRQVIRHAAHQGIDWAFVASGARDVVARVAPAQAAICLMYHSVADTEAARSVDPYVHMTPAEFEAQIAFLAKQRRVLSMDDLQTSLVEGRPLAPGSVLVTFDDGYLDNLEVAAPILEKYEIPALLYLPTGYIDRAETQWIDRLYTLFGSRSDDRLRLHGRAFNLADPAGHSAAYEVLRERLIGLNPPQRDTLLAQVSEQLQPSRQPPRLTMNWHEVRELRSRYPLFAVGGHGAEHLDLDGANAETATADIEECASTLQRELGEAPVHFSFPYARWNPASRELVSKYGFRTAVCSSDPVLRAGSDAKCLGRVDAKLSLPQLALRTDPGYLRLPRRLRQMS